MIITFLNRNSKNPRNDYGGENCENDNEKVSFQSLGSLDRGYGSMGDSLTGRDPQSLENRQQLLEQSFLLFVYLYWTTPLR